jgi:hypothetical protein
MILVILSSDDDDDDDDRTKRRESTSPKPADSACSSPVPSTGKVEAALNADACRAEQEPRSSPAEPELNTIVIPRKARMKDQVLSGQGLSFGVVPLFWKSNLLVTAGEDGLFINACSNTVTRLF